MVFYRTCHEQDDAGNPDPFWMLTLGRTKSSGQPSRTFDTQPPEFTINTFSSYYLTQTRFHSPMR